MALMKRNPAQEMTWWNNDFLPFSNNRFFQRNMNQMLNDFFRGDALANESIFGSEWKPAVDIAENSDSYIIKVELPGMSKDDVKISLEKNTLTIRGEKKHEEEKKDHNYHRTERSYGMFERSFTIPGSIKADSVDAHYKDGVLTLTLPKADEAKPTMIKVKVK